MIKTTPHIQLSEEADKRETTICIVYASVVMFGMLSLFLHGIAFLSWTEPTMEEVYARRRMDSNIKTMQNQIEGLYQWRNGMMFEYGKNKIEYENHRHQFWTGKIKQETVKGGD